MVSLIAPLHAGGSTASLRIGEQPGAGPPYSGNDIRNWDPRYNLKFEVSGYIPSSPGLADFSSSIGFIGFNDVAGGFVMTMYARPAVSPYWTLQLENNGNTHNIVSTAVVIPGVPLLLRLELTNSGNTVSMYMNDVIAATYTNGSPGSYIPEQALAFELTSVSSGVGESRLLLDYVYCSMNRLPIIAS